MNEWQAVMVVVGMFVTYWVYCWVKMASTEAKSNRLDFSQFDPELLKRYRIVETTNISGETTFNTEYVFMEDWLSERLQGVYSYDTECEARIALFTILERKRDETITTHRVVEI